MSLLSAFCDDCILVEFTVVYIIFYLANYDIISSYVQQNILGQKLIVHYEYHTILLW